MSASLGVGGAKNQMSNVSGGWLNPFLAPPLPINSQPAII